MSTNREELLLRAALENDLSGPAREATVDLNRLEASIDRLERRTGRAGPPVGALERRLRSASGETRSFTRHLEGAHRRVTSLSTAVSDRLGRALSGTAKALGAAGAAAGFFGLKAASNFQQAEIAFSTMLGSTERGHALFQQLQALNVKTPFELGDITGATQLLLRYGIAGEQVVPVLKSLLDAAALSGNPAENLNRLSLAVGQVFSRGSLSGEEARQLVQSGVNAYALMAHQLGITTEEARKLGEEGKLSAESFLEGLVGLEGPLENLRGGAEKLSGSLFGMMSNLKDAINVRLADAASPLVDSFTAAMPQITELVGTAVDELGPPLFGLIGLIATGATKLLPILSPILDALASGIGDLLKAAAPGLEALAPVADDLARALGELVDELVPVMPDLVDAFVALVMVLPEFIRLTAELVPLATPILRFATSLLELRPVRTILAGLLGVLLGYRALTTVVGGVWAMASALKALASGQVLVNTANAGAGAAGVAGAAGAAGGLAGAGGKVGRGRGLLRGLGRAAAWLPLAPIAWDAGKWLGSELGEAITGNEGSAQRTREQTFGFGTFGDPRGYLAQTAMLHGSIDAGLPGSRRVTNALHGSAAGGHPGGRSLDLTGSYLQTYAERLRGRGGWATIHDQGSGRHLHGVYPHGDAAPPPRAMTDGGGDDLPPIIIRIERVDRGVDLERAVERGIRRSRRDREERRQRRLAGAR